MFLTFLLGALGILYGAFLTQRGVCWIISGIAYIFGIRPKEDEAEGKETK